MAALDDAMKRRDAAKVRYLRDYLKIGGRTSKLAAFGMSDVADYVSPDQRLSVGIAFGKGDEAPGLALRVSKRDSMAHRAANDLAEEAEKDKSWADVRVVENLAVPSRTDVDPLGPEDADANGFPIGGDPLMVGVSVSHPKSPSGSLGGFVRFNGGSEGIISACHVLANSGRGVELSPEENAPLIYHPASRDVAGRLTPSHRIAKLRQFVELTTSSVELDVAVAALLPERQHIGNVIPSIRGARNAGQPILAPPPNSAIAEFKTVAKVGRRTRYTEGRLSAGFFDDVPLEVPGQGIVYYSRMFEIESSSARAPFAEPGDSGAAVFDIDSRKAFALVVGGGLWEDDGKARMLVYCCNLAAALDAMKVEWLRSTAKSTR